jgi:hypothetical protein
MRRLLLLVAALGLAAVAIALPSPAADEGPDFIGAAILDDLAGAEGSVWYCPWMNAGATRDAYIMIATVAELEAAVTLPSPIPNEDPDRAVVSVPGPGADPLEVASIVRRGDAPGFIELDDGPSAVGSVVTSDSIMSGDRCVASVPKLWRLPGGTTQPDRTTLLRLFNPFPEPAKVTIAGVSEFGETGLAGLTSVDVAGRTWKDIDMNEVVPLLDELSLTVSSEDGLVIPALIVSTDSDEAMWPGTGLSTVWEFPVVTQTGLSPSLVVSNPGESAAEVEIDVFTSESATPAARVFTVPPRSPLRVELGDLADEFLAIAVRSTEPLSAVVVAADVVQQLAEEDDGSTDTTTVAEPPPQRIAGTVGNPEPATRWLLTGPGGVRTAVSTVWILNSGAEPVTVSMQPLGGEELPAEKIQIEPGTVQRIVLSQEAGVSGFLLDATQPVSAAWSVEGGGGVAFISGISIDG